MKPEQFEKLDMAAKRMSLSNQAFAVLLQVTPTMVSRYRNSDIAKIGRRDTEMFYRCAKALKALRASYGPGEMAVMTPDQRLIACVEALKEAAPDEELKLPAGF